MIIEKKIFLFDNILKFNICLLSKTQYNDVFCNKIIKVT